MVKVSSLGETSSKGGEEMWFKYLGGIYVAAAAALVNLLTVAELKCLSEVFPTYMVVVSVGTQTFCYCTFGMIRQIIMHHLCDAHTGDCSLFR